MLFGVRELRCVGTSMRQVIELRLATSSDRPGEQLYIFSMRFLVGKFLIV